MLLNSSKTKVNSTGTVRAAPGVPFSTVCVKQRSAAFELLNDSAFKEKWEQLEQSCPWGTVFQSHLFVKVWFDNYHDKFDLALIFESDANAGLIGLLPLAIEKATGRICVAGDYHSEYQTWLATKANGNEFIEKSFYVLKNEFGAKRLQFLFLAPNTPLDFMKSDTILSRQSELRPHLRPLIEVADGEKFEASLRKKGNKSRLRQLERFGDVRIERLETSEQLEEVFDEIENYSRLRLSALHNVAPTLDPNRKPLHTALMQYPDLVYGSILRVGGKIASAKISLRNRQELLLSITSMSPFFARQSPSKVHLLMLGREIAKENIEIFDLSPGSGYKERFATHTETAYSLDIFFQKPDYLRHGLRLKMSAFIRKMFDNLNITKTRAYNIFCTFQHKIRRVNYSRLPLTIFKNIKRKIYEQRECRIYAFDVRKIDTLPNPKIMQVDSVENLLKYTPAEGWQATTREFHQTCLERLEAGTHAYTYVENDRLVHIGWMLERQAVSNVFEVEQEFNLPEHSAVLFDYYSDPEMRGKGLYRSSLLQGLHDAAKIPDTKQVFIGVLADNHPSRHVIEKLGFVYQGSLFKKTVASKVKKWQTWANDSKGQMS